MQMRAYWYREALWGGVLLGDRVELMLIPTHFVLGIEFDPQVISIMIGPIRIEVWGRPVARERGQ